eukprot:Awhi_evm1s11811
MSPQIDKDSVPNVPSELQEVELTVASANSLEMHLNNCDHDVDNISPDLSVHSDDLSSLGSSSSQENLKQLKFSPKAKVYSYTNTSIITHDDQHFGPDQKSKYFLPHYSKTPISEKQVVCVVIPFYNEEKCDLKRTLTSLYKQEQECHRAALQYGMGELVFQYLAVSDGYFKASNSMKRYITELFGKGWDLGLDGDDTSDCTRVIQKQRIINGEAYSDLVDIEPGQSMRLSMLVKRQNRKKPNSHEWFFRAFCPEFNGEYVFATDCGTLYARHCVFDMIFYLFSHPNTAACTGRQRVMTKTQQNIDKENLLQTWYRSAQAFDYESSISAFQGSFAMCGMLAVLPGPCGMYRYSDITRGDDNCLDYYFDFINTNSSNVGIFKGNLLLAEDRILSYAAALKTGKYTAWVPSAIFYCEAETKSETFVIQRRRWNNGTFAFFV